MYFFSDNTAVIVITIHDNNCSLIKDMLSLLDAFTPRTVSINLKLSESAV